MRFAHELWSHLTAAAPYFLLGLALAGLLHVLLPARWIARWMGGRGLSGVARAALVGIPLPICSCGVLPLALTLRHKGASRPAVASFLITTPESGVDSILLSWGILGPVFALFRPVAAFVSAMIAGILSLAWEEPDRVTDHVAKGPDLEAGPSHPDPCHSNSCHVETCQTCGHESHGPLLPDEELTQRAHRALIASLLPRLRSLALWLPTPAVGPEATAPRLWSDLVRPAWQKTVELADELCFWLTVGLVGAAALSLALPEDLAARGYGQGLWPMLILLVVGIPLYLCASASTPLAAVLIAKGISPGAALVFLLAGPATNLAAMLVLGRTFGRRFLQVFLGGIVVGALGAGLALDALLALTGWQVLPAAPIPGSTEELIGRVAALFLVALIFWRFSRGALRAGLREMAENTRIAAGWSLEWLLGPRGQDLARWGAALRQTWRFWVPALLLLLWGATGLARIPSGSLGFGFLGGRLYWPTLEPGLVWTPPWPLGRLDVWKVDYPRKSDVGFRTDLAALAQRKELTRLQDPHRWHSAVAAMNQDPELASYLTSDENLLELSFTVHFRVQDAVAFFYRADRDRDLVGLCARAVARELVMGRQLDSLLTAGRAEFEAELHERLEARLRALDAGVVLDAVKIVDIHPPSEAVFAFRDVSSAREDRETRISQALQKSAAAGPLTRGRAEAIRLAALTSAEVARHLAKAEAAAFLSSQEVYRHARAAVVFQLGIESSERLLAGREKWIVPAGTPNAGFTFWRDDWTTPNPSTNPPPNE